MKIFQKPNQEELSVYPELLTDIKQLVKDDQSFWYVKTKYNADIKKREKLAYLLGSPWLNIPVVKDINSEEFQQLTDFEIVSPDSKKNEDIYLIRLAQNYTITELPQKNLTTATARELIFSLWVRRRDAHKRNRAYVDGIPISFDYHIAFLQEGEGLRTEDEFYSREPKEWRVKITDQTVSTQSVRSLSGNDYTHFVTDIEVYKQEIRNFSEVIRTDRRNYVQVAMTAGFNQNEAITISTFLEESRKDLNPSKLIQVTTQDL